LGYRSRDALTMRPYQLARIAAEAEGVRLRGMATRMVTRIVCAVIALLFVLGAVAFAHIAAWCWLRIDRDLPYYLAAAILGGFDLFIAVILLLIASRSSPSRVEREALDVRKRAIAGIGTAMSLTQLVIPALRIASSMRKSPRRV
jgi:hypothetical protein